MKRMDDCCVDAIVTDPPYALTTTARWKNDIEFSQNQSDVGKRFSKGFMGKEWDGKLPGIEVWQECLRVVKPGAHMLAFGGTRTHHRLMVAIEDAGWEIRDCLMWVYGCLSEDTEILTRSGWERYHKTTTLITCNDDILVYDIQKGIFKWEIPERWSTYYIEQDTCYRIQSDNTDQLVSRNHRCLVEREGELAFVPAEELFDMENMPTLPDDFFELYKGQPNVLLSSMQWILSWARLENIRVPWKGWVDTRIKQKLSGENVGCKQPCMERWSNILQNTWELYRSEICSLSERIFRDGAERRICNGTPFTCGAVIKTVSSTSGGCSSYRSRSYEQLSGESNAVRGQSDPQTPRRYEITKAKVIKEKYTGMIFCPTVSTGAFVARRNGKVFITGNSGFPKSLDVSKAIDKAAGVEREVVGENPLASKQTGQKGTVALSGDRNPNLYITAPATDAAKQWNGWGTALKPAWEPIILCRKPLEGTVANNVQKWGVGGINIDGCRVEGIRDRTEYGLENSTRSQVNTYGEQKGSADFDSTKGRFPANLIHDGSDDVLERFPVNAKGMSGGGAKDNLKKEDWVVQPFNRRIVRDEWIRCDSGSAARFFYCAKASRSERGIDNKHPTVKPLALMRYLCRLITPPGGIVLDPFGGSGSTGVAAKQEGFQSILIELEQESYETANARIRGTK
jgi:DNA modification methylase